MHKITNPNLQHQKNIYMEKILLMGIGCVIGWVILTTILGAIWDVLKENPWLLKLIITVIALIAVIFGGYSWWWLVVVAFLDLC